MKSIVGDQLVNYSDEGEGDVILMLHGWGANLQSFDTLAKELAHKYRIVRIDFPAFGGSPRPSADWGIGEYGDLVIRFLDKKGIGQLHAVIAHSFGGRVTIKLAGRGMLHPDKIVLIGSGGIRHSSSPRQQAYKAVAKTGKQIMKLPGLNRLSGGVRRRLYETAGAMDYFEAGDMRNIFLRVINEDVREWAAKISVPTLLIWGENDEETPLSDGKIFHEKIAHSKLVVVRNAGHFTYLDQPQEVLSEIEAFLQ